MVFYKVVAIDPDGLLVLDEIFSEKEVQKYSIPKECLRKIDIPKGLTFRKYGKRFELLFNNELIIKRG